MRLFTLHPNRDAACCCSAHPDNVELNEKDLAYVLALVRRDLRYLRSRGKDGKKVLKASELANKLLDLKERSQ